MDMWPRARAFIWKQGRLLLLDQRQLPQKKIWMTCRRWQDVARGIRDMHVRGAPAIGCVAAYGIVLAAKSGQNLTKAHAGLLVSRPTAVNLRWALDRMKRVRQQDAQTLEHEAIAIEEEDRAANRRIGELGANLLPEGATVLTHCNTGSLATAGFGTAFGILWTGHRQGKVRKVIACETRPYLQGARLTTWELKQEGIPCELITDNMAAYLMKTEHIDAVTVGADRIAANGDTANKIGTYGLAVLARHHRIPFYVAAPSSTVDLSMKDGAMIPIEERPAREVTEIRGIRVAPPGVRVRHPAFDVTPAELISAIVTEKGVAKPPYADSLCRL